MPKKIQHPESYLPIELLLELSKLIDQQHKQKSESTQGIFVLLNGYDATIQHAAIEFLSSMLDLKIIRIDLNKLINDYIGETEKNLNKMIKKAMSSNAILFFDEADAIFGKRTNVETAHDKYANQEISYVLQKLEDIHRIIVFATSKKIKPLAKIRKRFYLVS